ncbi:hypothetical protein Q0Z83_052350 [Actinoplanes sichuanensis]|uniref:DUF4131 domain-containing protein n=1 Tax=Actinoplanes sichuanensis TaxID=512349 RepID=A0ABW4ASG5_9ACTN|nr:hypothetical protein [Actinoplanes sichuanensis]BEL07044.1 hypothetical protein Q0Z83_052350 [Actinoplanes sichuanensis]
MSLRRWTRLLGRWALTVLAAVTWFGAVCGLGLIFMTGTGALSDTTPGRMWAVWLLLVAACFLTLLADRTRPGGVLARHAESAGWEQADTDRRKWPWAEPVGGTIRVRQAWSFTAGGFPVTAGEVRWTGRAFGGATDDADGRGVVVVVHLSTPVPSMAYHVPFERIGDSPLLDRVELRKAFLTRRIPPWTIREQCLFTVEPAHEGITPALIGSAVRRARLVASLLDLTTEVRSNGRAGVAA